MPVNKDHHEFPDSPRKPGVTSTRASERWPGRALPCQLTEEFSNFLRDFMTEEYFAGGVSYPKEPGGKYYC